MDAVGREMFQVCVQILNSLRTTKHFLDTARQAAGQCLHLIVHRNSVSFAIQMTQFLEDVLSRDGLIEIVNDLPNGPSVAAQCEETESEKCQGHLER